MGDNFLSPIFVTNLLDCFIKAEGKNQEFDDHGAACTICYGQAMLALLWNDAGYSTEEMTAGYETIFAEMLRNREK